MMTAVFRYGCYAHLALLTVLSQAPSRAEMGDILHKFESPVPGSDWSFGCSVAAVGDKVLIGQCQSSLVANDAGAAYLFDSSTGELLNTLVPPAPVAHQCFGLSVAALGNDLLIGAPGYNSGGETAEGSAFLFDGSTGELLHTFRAPTPTEGEYFGNSITAVGSNVLVGTRGSTRSYLYDGSSGDLLQTFDAPGLWARNAPRSMAALGDNVLIGAPDAPRGGAVALFDGSTGALLRVFEDPTRHEASLFGCSVATLGDKVIVGSYDSPGGTYMFDSSTGDLLHTFQPPWATSWGKQFVTVVGDDVLIAINNEGTDAEKAGAAFLFDGSTGDLLHTFRDPTPQRQECFGSAAAAYGNNVLISAGGVSSPEREGGKVYLFKGIPEPSSIILLAVGAAAMLISARRHSRRKRGQNDSPPDKSL